MSQFPMSWSKSFSVMRLLTLLGAMDEGNYIITRLMGLSVAKP